MTPEKRRQSAQEYRESLSPERQEYWDAATGRKTYQIPDKPVRDRSEGQGFATAVLSLLSLIALYRCYDAFMSVKPEEGLFGFLPLILVWIPLAVGMIWLTLYDD